MKKNTIKVGPVLERGREEDAASRIASEEKKKNVCNSFKLLSDGYRLSRLSRFSHWLLQLPFP
jgi:hypothetical protein